jgi:predicted DNA-binding transcriptional regulator AlpA
MRHYGSKQADCWMTLPATTVELCCSRYNRDLSRPLLGWREVAKITAMSGSRVASHHATLWKQARGRVDVATCHNREFCCSGYNRDLSRSLLGWREVAKITATSDPRVASHHATLWKQARGRVDVTTCHNSGTLLFWLQSRPFTLAAWVA